ncbi:hypothetical protein D3C87_1443560 [compost metagenome]
MVQPVGEIEQSTLDQPVEHARSFGIETRRQFGRRHALAFRNRHAPDDEQEAPPDTLVGSRNGRLVIARQHGRELRHELEEILVEEPREDLRTAGQGLDQLFAQRCVLGQFLDRHQARIVQPGDIGIGLLAAALPVPGDGFR